MVFSPSAVRRVPAVALPPDAARCADSPDLTRSRGRIRPATGPIRGPSPRWSDHREPSSPTSARSKSGKRSGQSRRASIASSALMRREGLPAWSIEAARDHDLRGKSYIEIAKGLEYDDWQFAHPERSRATEQRVSSGRQLLHDLGAWPWAVSPKGRLPARWWEEERFTRALAFWARDALLDCLNDVFRTVEIASSDAGVDDRDVMARSAFSSEAARQALWDFSRPLADGRNSEAA